MLLRNRTKPMNPQSYHADRSRVSNSSLKLFARAPILWKKWHEGTLPEVKTDDLVFGSLLHCLIFEPLNLNRLFAVKPDDAPDKPTKPQLNAWQRFGTLAKPSKAQISANEKTTEKLRWWDAFATANEGKESVDAGDIAEAKLCQDGLNADPKCREFLALPGFSEVEIQWVDEATGLPCKAKLDRLARHAIIDLKTAADATTEGFKKAAFRLGYHRQAAWYLGGVESALKQGTLPPAVADLLQGVAPKLFVFPVVEKDDEHLAHCFPATEDFIQRGRDENALLMRELKHCMLTGNWPGLSQHESGMTPLGLPSWMPELPSFAPETSPRSNW